MPPFALTHQQAHLWVVPTTLLHHHATAQACHALLDAAEMATMARFIPQHSRDEYLVTRALCRSVLSQYAAMPPAAWQFVRNAYGRPEIAPHLLAGQNLRFNLTHTRNLCACLVTHTLDAGVDAEWLGRDRDILAVANHAFSAAEAAFLRKLPADAQKKHFFHLWTLKEAYVKARGMGLHLGFDTFSMHLEGDTIAIVPPPDDTATDWQFEIIAPTPQHILAVALRGASGSVALTLHNHLPL